MGLGLPTNSIQEANGLELDRAKRIDRIKAKTQQLQDLILQQIAFKNLVERNKEREKREGPPAPNSAIQLPFIIVNTSKKTVIDCSISNDKMEYLFNFDDTFEIHDDMEVLICSSRPTHKIWDHIVESTMNNISGAFKLLSIINNNKKNLVTKSNNLVISSRNLRTSTILFDEIKVVVCPAFAESITEGDLRWEKAAGDAVSEDEVLAEIETDKTSVPVPSPVSGVVEELLVEDGDTVSPGAKLVKIKVGAGGGGAAKPKAPEPAAAPAPAPVAPPPPAAPTGAIPVAPPPAPAVPSAPVATTPVAAIRPPPPPAPAPGPGAAPIVRMPPADPTKEIAGTRSEHNVKMNRMRLKIAGRLKEAQNTNAMLTTFNELDMSSIMQLRK